MSNELIKDQIILDKKIGKETTQIMREGDIIVPDIKPDMSVILQTESNVTITKVEVTNDRVNFIGKLNISILYLAKGTEKPVHSISLQENIDDFINMEGITKEMWAEGTASISNIEYKMLNDRKINYRAIIDVTILGESKDYYDVIVDINDVPSTQLKKNSMLINKNVENKEDSIVIKDEISVTLGKPSIREILQTSIEVNNKESRVSNGKVNLIGELNVTILYKGDDDDSVIEFIENEIPFNGIVDMQNARDDMFADVFLNVKDKYIQIKPDSDGEDRIIEVEATISALIKTYSQENIDVLEDVYIINKDVNMTKKQISYPKLVCRNKNQTQIKEIVQLDNDSPDMLQIYRISGKAHLDNVTPLEDKIIAEGIIETNILYVAENDDTPLFSYSTIIPYKQTIETKGTKKDMEINLTSNIDHVGFNMLSGREVEVRFLMSFNTQVNKDENINIITDIDITDMSEDYLNSFASVTVYCVQKGDTLWSIAKYYNTTVTEIAEMNQIENPNSIFVGEKIIILKKVFS